VAGFDFTFPAAKSVSRMRAVADAGTQALIMQAHCDAGGGYADSGLRHV
jgi:TrwC relaxase